MLNAGRLFHILPNKIVVWGFFSFLTYCYETVDFMSNSYFSDFILFLNTLLIWCDSEALLLRQRTFELWSLSPGKGHKLCIKIIYVQTRLFWLSSTAMEEKPRWNPGHLVLYKWYLLADKNKIRNVEMSILFLFIFVGFYSKHMTYLWKKSKVGRARICKKCAS